MADQFAAQFRRYWLVIVTVVGACASVFGFQLAMMVQIYDLKTDVGILNTKVEINLKALQTFADQGARYTLRDHEANAREQRAVDAVQNNRLTILENQSGQR